MSTDHDDGPRRLENSRDVGPDVRSSGSSVDRSLISWMLSLSPAERLEVAQDWVSMVDAFDGNERAD